MHVQREMGLGGACVSNGNMGTKDELGQPRTKREYLGRLNRALRRCPRRERRDALRYYDEIISDLCESSLNVQPNPSLLPGDAPSAVVPLPRGAALAEAEIIAGMESPEAAAASIIAELPVVPRTLSWGARLSDPVFWVLLVLASPFWASALFSVVALGLCVYVLIWMVALLVWSVLVSGFAAGLFGIAAAVWGLFRGNVVFMLMMLGAGLTLLALTALFVSPVLSVTVFFARISWQVVQRILMLFIKRGDGDALRHDGSRRQGDNRDKKRRRWSMTRREWLRAAVLLTVGIAVFLIGFALAGFDITALNQRLPFGEINIANAISARR